MESDELQACKDALSEIIDKCDTFRGLADAYKDKPEHEPAAVEVEIKGEPADDHDLDQGGSSIEELLSDDGGEEDPGALSVVERPAARSSRPSAPPPIEPKRGRGRPRKGSY